MTISVFDSGSAIECPVSALQKEISDLEAKKDKADEDLTQMIQAIVLDENF